jgi:hypothetical protein
LPGYRFDRPTGGVAPKRHDDALARSPTGDLPGSKLRLAMMTPMRLATAAQCAMKMNQIRPLTTRATATVMIIFCNISMHFS